MKKIILLLSIIALAGYITAQTVYPVHIPRGQSKTLSADEFDLFVLKQSQFDNALADSKQLKLYKEEVSELKKTIDLYEEKTKELEGLKATIERDRDFYKENWQTCDTDLQKIGSNLKRQKLFTRIALISIPIAFGAGLLVAL